MSARVAEKLFGGGRKLCGGAFPGRAKKNAPDGKNPFSVRFFLCAVGAVEFAFSVFLFVGFLEIGISFAYPQKFSISLFHFQF